MQWLRVGASCWATLAILVAEGFMVNVTATISAGSVIGAILAGMIHPQTLGAPPLLHQYL
jgi:hypothetical protein